LTARNRTARKRPAFALARFGGPGSAAAPRPRNLVWFLDLDDTLHDASHAMFGAIDRRMTDFLVQHLQIEPAAADFLRRDYWRRYGATLAGLVRHHRVDPQRFLDETHDFDIPVLLRAERGVRTIGRRLVGRKVLLTNSPAAYAGRVLRGIGLHRHITTRYAVEDMRVHGQYRPKPAPSLFRAVLAREKIGVRGSRVDSRHLPVLVDDNADNLKAAHAAGFATVMIARPGSGGGRRLAGGAYVSARVHSIHQLPAVAARLRGRGPR
jgi:putative hydrolase of the HAD superfamily